MHFSLFILFEIHWVSLICGLISFIRTGNFKHYHMQCVCSSDFYSLFLELGLDVMLSHSVLIFLNLFFIFFTSFCCHLGSIFSDPYFISLIFPSVSSNLLFKRFTYFFNIINFIFNYLSSFSDLLRNFHSFSLLKIFSHFFYFFTILNIFIFNFEWYFHHLKSLQVWFWCVLLLLVLSHGALFQCVFYIKQKFIFTFFSEIS